MKRYRHAMTLIDELERIVDGGWAGLEDGETQEERDAHFQEILDRIGQLPIYKGAED